MKWTTSWASAASYVPAANGRCSDGASRTSTPGNRSRTAATNDDEGSTAETPDPVTRRTSSPVSAPVPQPTSRTRMPGPIPAVSAIAADSWRDHRPMNASYAVAATSNDIAEG